MKMLYVAIVLIVLGLGAILLSTHRDHTDKSQISATDTKPVRVQQVVGSNKVRLTYSLETNNPR